MRLRGFWRVSRRTVSNPRCPFTPGGPSSRPCVNPHWREAISLRDLRDALPPPPDAQEPHAHSHRREALPCKLLRQPNRARPPPKDGVIPERRRMKRLIPVSFFSLVWKMWPPLPTQKSAAAAPPSEARRGHQHQGSVSQERRWRHHRPGELLLKLLTYCGKSYFFHKQDV